MDGFEEELKKIEEINNRFEDYKSHSAMELACRCIENGQMEDAEKLLNHENLCIRTGASEALTKHYIEKEKPDSIKKLLQSDDNGAWNGVYWALYEFITMKCDSVDALYNLGKMLESSLVEWSNVKRRPLDIQLQYQDAISGLLTDIGEKIKSLDKGQRFSDLEWRKPRNSSSRIKKIKTRY